MHDALVIKDHTSYAHFGVDQIPIHPVVLQKAIIVGEVHDAILVFQGPPIRWMGFIFLIGIIGDEWPANLFLSCQMKG
jgi:hypothetical protein